MKDWDKKLKEYRKHLEGIMSHDPTGDPATNQAKRLSAVQAEVLIDLIETMRELDKSNKDLAKSNLRLQYIVAGLTTVTVIVTLMQLR